MDGQILQEWLEKVRKIKDLLDAVESNLEDAELSPSQNTGLTITYDFDVSDILSDVTEAVHLLSDLNNQMEDHDQ